jgi:hypothetical protein
MSGENNSTDLLGKKIFFLYPSAVIQNEIIAELVQQEFEVYIVKDPVALRRILRKYPDSIVFADIDEGMNEKDWEAWIRGTMGDPATAKVKIGILSGNKDENLQQKYVSILNIPCGYTVLKSDLKNPSRQLM